MVVFKRFLVVLLASLALVMPIGALGEITPPSPPGEPVIINDEGGVANITGIVSYTNPFFTSGVSQPLVILEDQAGFVDRDEYFIFPIESQVLGQITSDFFRSPFSYNLSLPQIPRGSLRDVSNRGADDVGVMIFTIAYWSNTFGDPYLEVRDQFGGGWSTAYASTIVSTNPETNREIIGGKLVIYAPEEGQGFPSGFGDDGLLFTQDDPIVTIPQGWSVVDLDTEPFTFDRAREQFIELYEPETAALIDYSDQDYPTAFASMVDLFRTRYAFTEHHNIDWQALYDAYLPRFIDAFSPFEYALALRDFLWEIPDGHINMSLDLLIPRFRDETDNGFGFAFRETDDGRFFVTFVTPNSPAANAGITVGAELLARDGVPLDTALDDVFVWAHQALGTSHTMRLQQLRYITRAPQDTIADWTFINADGAEQVASLTAVPERDSFAFSSFNVNASPTQLPVEHTLLPNGYGYVAINSFSDDAYLTIQLWERMIRDFRNVQARGIIVDMRRNGGGSGFLSTQMAAYFFNEALELGNTGFYNEDLDEFYFDERGVRRFYLPPVEQRWLGDVAVLIEPSCWSACEFFTYALTLQDRAEVIGFYPTGGLGGSVNDFIMPEGIRVRFTVGRAVDMQGNIHIEGQGVAPTFRVPLTREALFAEEDVLLNAAIRILEGR